MLRGKYEKTYGYWRPVIRDTLFKFLECENLHNGFARVRCDDCGEEYLLAFSCKTKCCPSCSQRRSLEFGERVVEDIIDDVPVRSGTFTIPKMLRPYFKFDRALYPKLSQCAYEAIRESFQAVLDNREVIPGMITGIHTFGNFLNPHPHIHSIFSQGCFDKKNTFHLSPDVLQSLLH
ncbi:MAG: transposase zinc-binding domain-containing protein [Vulcanimicrobiota bacterium]